MDVLSDSILRLPHDVVSILRNTHTLRKIVTCGLFTNETQSVSCVSINLEHESSYVLHIFKKETVRALFPIDKDMLPYGVTVELSGVILVLLYLETVIIY